MKGFIGVTVALLLLASARADTKTENDAVEAGVYGRLRARCSASEPGACLAVGLAGYVDRALRTAAVQLGEDVVIVEESEPSTTAAPAVPLARSGVSDEDLMQQILANKAWNFVSTRSLRWKLLNDADLVLSSKPDEEGSLNIGMTIKEARAIESGRGKMKNLGPILAAAAMKIGLLGGLAFKGLALLVGKALLVSKIALLLASIIGLKKLFSHQKHVTYEVVAHPHHHESHQEGISSGWGRDFNPQDLAYAKQIPQH